jgi:hypothetical protein
MVTISQLHHTIRNTLTAIWQIVINRKQQPKYSNNLNHCYRDNNTILSLEQLGERLVLTEEGWSGRRVKAFM